MDIFRGKPKTSEEMAKKLIRSSFQKKKAMVNSLGRKCQKFYDSMDR